MDGVLHGFRVADLNGSCRTGGSRHLIHCVKKRRKRLFFAGADADDRNAQTAGQERQVQPDLFLFCLVHQVDANDDPGRDLHRL